MTLKDYQNNTLKVLGEYFDLLHYMSPADAYQKITSSADMIERLGNQRGYDVLGSLTDTPVVSIKVPTGGGKTILAAHAVKLVAESQGREFPLVLWFAPSDTIRRQTAEALKKPFHPYRQALDEAFHGRVRVFDLDEKFNITPSDISGNACVVVATEQAFVKKNTEKYKVYVDHEDLDPHFAALPVEDGMDVRDDDPTKPKSSFANLLMYHHAIVIVDEAHKMVSELSQETLIRLKPGAILGLTATPEKGNNTVYSVWAKELFDEEMVKLPIELKEFSEDWTQAVLEAIAKREELQKLTDAEPKGEGYLRPLVLFQATKVNGDVPVEKLKAFLVDEAKRKPEEIAVVTGEQKELDDVDVTDPQCPIKYVITVQALKEGWDCPSAYILCSVANVESNTDTVQLLGRVMRQPQARRRKTNQLNRAYAYVMSKSFGASASELVNGLRKKGFEQGEAYQAIEVQTEFSGFTDEDTLFSQSGGLAVDKEVMDAVSKVLPESVKVEHLADGSAVLNVTSMVASDDAAKVVEKLVSKGFHKVAAEFSQKVKWQKKLAEEHVPAKEKSFCLPKIAATVQDELVLTSEKAYDLVGANVETALPPVLGEDEFKLVPVGNGFQLFLDGNEMKTKATAEDDTPYLQGYSGAIGIGEVVNALDSLTPAKCMSAKVKRGWIAKIVNHLVSIRKFTPEQLYGFRYLLKRRIDWHVEAAYLKVRESAYQQVFGFEEHQYPLELDLENGFVLDENLYKDDLPFIKFYDGNYQFSKHFLGPHRVPKFDGEKPHGEGEEFECAKLIDAHPNVDCWLRVLANHNQSFRLPLAHTWFYPDFVGLLKDGRFFVIEYKGEHLRHADDTVAKDAIGRLWAKQDTKKCLYATIFKTTDAGLDMYGQVNQLLGVIG